MLQFQSQLTHHRCLSLNTNARDGLWYRISLNNSRGRLFFFSHQTKRVRLFEGRRLFHNIVHSGSRVLNILLFFPIKSKNNRVKETKRELFKCSKFASLINFYCQYPWRHHRWLISFAGSDSTTASPSRFTAMDIDSGLPLVVGGGWAVMRGRRLIEGRLILEEIR